ncbi:MAG: NADH-quinone oxidoreductase subunit C [Elusimicrobiota bacterium]|nr:NADH-quinone oxidoreductase subunit C [Elusimicrobiota bacterium]
MNNDELFSKIKVQFSKVEKAAVQVKDYLTIRLATKDELLPLAEYFKNNGFDMLETVTATDLLGPVDMKGFIRQQNFNPFLPEGATPQIEAAATAGYAYKPVMDLLYVFYSVTEKARVFVKLEIAREGVSVASLTPFFKSADWQERETFDLLGIRFDGHPNLIKILTPDFTVGHPLRKDYVHVKDRFDE